MKSPRIPRPLLWAFGVLLLLTALAFAGLHFAAQTLRGQVIAALGPDSEVGDIHLGWSSLTLSQLRIKAPKGWPAADTLRAERIVIKPDLRALLSADIRISKIDVEGAYLSVWRTRDSKLRLLPSLLEKPAAPQSANSASASKTTCVVIDQIVLNHGALEFFDASIKKPALNIQLANVAVTLDDLHLPELTAKSQLAINGTLKGVHQDGQVGVKGWMAFANQDGELATQLRGIDLIALQPYLIKTSDTGVKRGTLDLTLNSNVHNRRLVAPGVLTLTDLQLANGNGWGAFMGLPRQAVVSSLKDRDGKISLKFTLAGNLDDPRFSLNENLSKRISAGMAEGLGVSIKGLAGGVGKAIGDLFGK